MSKWTPGRIGPLAHWYRTARREFLAANPMCWLCGHMGADQIDHHLPVSMAPDLAMVVANWRPAHGWQGCPTCGIRCNQVRGTKTAVTISPRSRRW